MDLNLQIFCFPAIFLWTTTLLLALLRWFVMRGLRKGGESFLLKITHLMGRNKAGNLQDIKKSLLRAKKIWKGALVVDLTLCLALLLRFLIPLVKSTNGAKIEMLHFMEVGVIVIIGSAGINFLIIIDILGRIITKADEHLNI